jgi:hypothetical protein
MATINLDQELKHRDGKEFNFNGDKLDLCGALLYSLEFKSEGQTQKESMECYKLRKTIFEGGVINISSEEIVLFKKKCHEALSQPAFFAVVDILEG